MSKIGIINKEQYNEIKNKLFKDSNYYNPIKIDDSEWFISDIEISMGKDKFKWMADIKLIEFDPKLHVDKTIELPW